MAAMLSEFVWKNIAKDILSVNMAQCGLDSLQIKLVQGEALVNDLWECHLK